MASKEWTRLQATIIVRATEMLEEGRQAEQAGKTLSPHRWAFVQALEWRDSSDVRRGTLQYRYADAIIQWMCSNWATELN